jgi:hypothetical protein
MIHSLFDSQVQNQNIDSNIQYPREDIQNMRKGVMVNGSEVYYGKGKKVPTNYNKNRTNIKYNKTIQKTREIKTSYTYNKIVHNNQIKYINKEENKIKEIKKDNTDIKSQKVSIDKKMELTYDDSKPSCYVSIRLYNGDIIKAKFNCCAKFGDVYSFVKKWSNYNNNFVLLDGFPPRPLKEYGKTIAELGIENAVLTQRIN